MGTPIAKQKNIVASSTKMSMGVGYRGLVVRRRARGGRADGHVLDDEEQQDDPAGRDRQVSDADRKEGKIRDSVVPGRGDELAAPDHHEQREAPHEGFDEDLRG